MGSSAGCGSASRCIGADTEPKPRGGTVVLEGAAAGRRPEGECGAQSGSPRPPGQSSMALLPKGVLRWSILKGIGQRSARAARSAAAWRHPLWHIHPLNAQLQQAKELQRLQGSRYDSLTPVLLCSRDASCLASITSRDPPDRGLGPDSVTYEHVSSKQQRAALLARESA